MKESPPTKFKSTQKHQAGASKPFSLNPTGTLSRRHFAQFVSAIDRPRQSIKVPNRPPSAEVTERRLHPGEVEGQEFRPRHFARRHGELPVGSSCFSARPSKSDNRKLPAGQ